MVEYIAPCHCSGELCVERFKLKFGERFITVGAGDVIKISAIGK
jgi:metal-dependent hydrolase (beta-lactamase superfamily II)